MTTTIRVAIPVIASAGLAFCLAPFVSKLAVIVGAIDMPGERRIHRKPIPRLGGIAVVSAVAAVWCTTWLLGILPWPIPRDLMLGIGIGVVPVFLVSVIDDIRSMPAIPKFIAHIVGASLAVMCGVSLGSEVHLFGATIFIGWLAMPLSVFWIVGVTNAFNIIDGLDGLASGLALISAVSMAGVFAVLAAPAMAWSALVLAAALAGFLPYNRHPARMFLGDTGATAIGFCLAAFALRGGSTLTSGFAALLPVFILGLPIADTLIAMVRRALGRLDNPDAGIFVPDRKHIHHRLLDLGIHHGRAVMILHGAGIIFALAAFGSMFLKAREASLVIVALMLAASVGINRLQYEEFALIRRGTMLRIYEAPVVQRAMFVVFLDLFMCVVAAYVAAALKADDWSIHATRTAVVHLVSVLAPLTIAVFWKSSMYRGAWQLAELDDLRRAGAATLAVILLGSIAELILASHNYSTILIYGLASLILVVGSRASYVLLLNSQRRASKSGTPVLLYGAGHGGAAASRELFRNVDAGMRPIGFIDDDVSKLSKIVNGLPVLGASRDLEEIVRTHGARAVLVTTPKVRPARLGRVAAVCKRTGSGLFRMNVRVMPLVDCSLQPTAPVEPPAPVAMSIQTSIAPKPALSVADLAMVGTPCGACGSLKTHRSRVRNFLERLRKAYTTKRLFRCQDCGWRGWLEPLEHFSVREAVADFDLTVLDSPSSFNAA